MKYNAIMPRDDDSFYLWYDSLKGFRLNIIGDGNCNFNREADVLFHIERERIIERIRARVCFDALADHDAMETFRHAHPEVVGRCAHHGGKCTDLLLLISELESK